MKPGTSLIPYFHVILTGKSISSTIFMTQGHLQGHPLPSALPKRNIDNLGLPQGSYGQITQLLIIKHSKSRTTQESALRYVTACFKLRNRIVYSTRK